MTKSVREQLCRQPQRNVYVQTWDQVSALIYLQIIGRLLERDFWQTTEDVVDQIRQQILDQIREASV